MLRAKLCSGSLKAVLAYPKLRGHEQLCTFDTTHSDCLPSRGVAPQKKRARSLQSQPQGVFHPNGNNYRFERWLVALLDRIAYKLCMARTAYLLRWKGLQARSRPNELDLLIQGHSDDDSHSNAHRVDR